MLIDSLWAGLQAQNAPPGSAPPSVTPEVLKALADLVKASGGVARAETWWSSERINALASAVGTITWPLTVLAVIFFLRKPILALVSNVTEVEVGGAKFKILQQQLNRAEVESRQTEPFQPPTAAQQERAATVEHLLEGDLALVRREAEALAQEYERIRASLPFSDNRTRKLEAVVAKMRAIGRAVYPLRLELARSSSPGRRLQAIAALQVTPDYDMLDWLAHRLAAETPFVSYHALLALVQAAKDPAAAGKRDPLLKALSIAQSEKRFFEDDEGRGKLLRAFEEAVAAIPS